MESEEVPARLKEWGEGGGMEYGLLGAEVCGLLGVSEDNDVAQGRKDLLEVWGVVLESLFGGSGRGDEVEVCWHGGLGI